MHFGSNFQPLSLSTSIVSPSIPLLLAKLNEPSSAQLQATAYGRAVVMEKEENPTGNVTGATVMSCQGG